MTSKDFSSSSFLSKEQGLSLVELIVMSSLLLTILALAYNFWQFGFTSFVSAEKRSNVQQNARMATDFIHNELRFATSVELLNPAQIPAAQDIGTDTHYILLTGSKIEYRARNISQIIPKNIAGEVSFSLDFTKSDSDLLSVVIAAVIDKQQPYSHSSQVRLKNLSLFNETITGGTHSTAIRFVRQTFNPPLSLSVQPGAVVAGTGFSQTFTLTLLNETFSESFGQGSITLSGDFSGLNVSLANRTGPATASITLSGDLTAVASGSGQILIKGSGLTGGSPLSAAVSVVPDAIFTLNILRSGNGATTPVVGLHLYPQGATATLTATPTAPWQFHQWQIGNAFFSSAQQTITMDSDKTATSRFRLPLTSILGGSYVSHNGVTYLKLTGANNRVMRLHLSGSGNWSNPTPRPTRIELEGGIFDNSRRIAGVGAYWTSTKHNTNRGVYISSTGAFQHEKMADSLGIREALSLPGILFAYSGSGTFADPFILNQ
ncbi:MAG: hypothetical protein KGZ54_08250 [Dethiobacter sp.]|nr:hypothetical protein [Dethiobacter sp.]MBS3901991.1 hypothetical protein [Dethiobacter sp.]MBS3988373.1 hypothetical protein [Dethiobacter sp.]